MRLLLWPSRYLAATSVSSRAAILWMHKIIQLIPAVRQRLPERGNRVLEASAFSVDASLNTLPFL